MSEVPECPKCSDIFGNDQNHIKAPKLLKCGDSICKECLEDLIQNTNEEFVLCPICKEKVKKEDDINNYITNKDLIKIVNGYFNVPENKIEEQEGIGPIQYNIILLGNSGVGKTCIFNRFSKNIYSEKFPSTVGCETTKYYIKYKNQKYILNFRDPAGQEKYKAVTKSFLKQNDGVLFIFDLSDRKSFEDLETWYNLYKEENENIVGILIGNKSDNKHNVKEEEAIQFTFKHELRKYIETSAKLDKNIKKSITYLLEQIIQSKTSENDENLLIDSNISLVPEIMNNKKKCSC